MLSPVIPCHYGAGWWQTERGVDTIDMPMHCTYTVQRMGTDFVRIIASVAKNGDGASWIKLAPAGLMPNPPTLTY